MARTIWKIEISSSHGGMMLPKGATPLSVHTQNGQPCMWMSVDPNAEREKRDFRAFGTGQFLPENIGTFVGTFLVENDALVFHVFEINS